MKIVITGSLGNISKPLATELVQKGHAVTVISSKPEKQAEIEALGAQAAIGSLEDANFLASAFNSADAVYCMIPPNLFAQPDHISYYRRIADNYAKAIQQSGVKRVIHLSSYGAHLDKGTGIILGSHNSEQIFLAIPGIKLTIMRPTYFYYNLLLFTEMIRHTGTIAANYGDDKIVMVSPIDIAEAVAEEITNPGSTNKIRYVASDEQTGPEIAGIFGAAIGMPHLKWQVISDEQMQSNYEAHGLPKHLAEALVDIFIAVRNGKLAEEYYLNQPAALGKVKLADYAKEFAAVYHKTEK
ncbi:MAG: NAD(P)H-binding protein [Bacteroidota bacterium]